MISTTILWVLLSILAVILLTSRFRLNAFFALVLVSLVLALLTIDLVKVLPVLKEGFGSTLASIGLIILFGTILGEVLNASGATHTIAMTFIRKAGVKGSARAISITGFLAGIPIFCDSGFIVLSSVANNLAKKTGTSRVRMAVSLAIVMYIMHSLVPPHPGITAAVGIIGSSPGTLLMLGLVVSIPAISVAYAWVKWASKRVTIQSSNEEPQEQEVEVKQSFLRAIIPVILPLLLIVAGSVFSFRINNEPSSLSMAITFLGDPVIALLIAVLSAFLLWPRKKGKAPGTVIQTALVKAGPILAITAAGGMFGSVIRATGAGEAITAQLIHYHAGLFLPYILAFILKSAQGSTTVAAITAASIFAPMMAGLGLDYEWGRLFVLLAIGSGSMAVSHANDSYFWVVSKFSDIPAGVNLKVFSSASLVASMTAFLFTWMLSQFFI